jgi:hypothetical protein
VKISIVRIGTNEYGTRFASMDLGQGIQEHFHGDPDSDGPHRRQPAPI